MIIDSHQHFWQLGRFEYAWMGPDLGVLYRDYLPEMLEPILKECGVAKTILVQASNSLAETDWLLGLADQHQFIAGVVGWVDLTDSGMHYDPNSLECGGLSPLWPVGVLTPTYAIDPSEPARDRSREAKAPTGRRTPRS